MNRFPHLIALSLALVAGAAAFPDTPTPQAATDSNAAAAPSAVTTAISQLAARLIADAIPREYARTKDWGRTREITTGLRSSGNFFDFDIRRQKSRVNDGVWKAYRVTLVDPDKNLTVNIDNLRQLAADRIGLTFFVTARLHATTRAKVYESGVHIIALEAEADTTVRLWLDTEIAVEPAPSKSFIPGLAIHPVVTSARLNLDDFHLQRISDLRGPIAEELGDGLRHVIEDELSGPKLADKINRSIEKRRDKLTFTADMLLAKPAPKQQPPK